MTDTAQSSPSKAGALSQQIVALLIEEDPETRRRAIHAAMTLLGDALPLQAETRTRGLLTTSDDDDETSLSRFFNRDEALKPADHAQLCAAYHFSTYGTAAFSLEELRAIAGEAGVILPDRLDMTLVQAAKKGKRLFQAVGKGSYKPTAAAGLAFKERWGVKPGKTAKQATAAK